MELLEICKEINETNHTKKQRRNISVIQDVDGNNIVVINDIRFKEKIHSLERSPGIFERICRRFFIRWHLPVMLYISDLICQVNIQDLYIQKVEWSSCKG